MASSSLKAGDLSSGSQVCMTDTCGIFVVVVVCFILFLTESSPKTQDQGSFKISVLIYYILCLLHVKIGSKFNFSNVSKCMPLAS